MNLLTEHEGVKVYCSAQYRKEPRSTELTTGGVKRQAHPKALDPPP